MPCFRSQNNIFLAKFSYTFTNSFIIKARQLLARLRKCFGIEQFPFFDKWITSWVRSDCCLIKLLLGIRCKKASFDSIFWKISRLYRKVEKNIRFHIFWMKALNNLIRLKTKMNSIMFQKVAGLQNSLTDIYIVIFNINSLLRAFLWKISCSFNYLWCLSINIVKIPVTIIHALINLIANSLCSNKFLKITLHAVLPLRYFDW